MSLSRIVLSLIALGILASCGGGGKSSESTVGTIAAQKSPAITQQPANQSIPMGLPASFAVVASGDSLIFQWMRNGSAIAGATNDTYLIPATSFADSGAQFTVAVSNSAGELTSNPAALTVTARAPMAGDLRFQQVDAPATVNGWGSAGVATSSLINGRSAQDFAPSIGSPFYVGSNGNCGAVPVTNGLGCTWSFTETPFTTTASSPTLLAGYGGDFYDNFQSDLQSNAWPAFGNGVAAASPTAVITSLDLEPENVLFAVSWMQTMQQTSFELVQNTVPSNAVQAAATREGAGSRVITAISNNAGNITYFAYGWQADTSTIYEAQVVTASPTDAPTAAADLASQGFIITATGQADNLGNVIMVGTRVQGDSMARSFVPAQGNAAVQAMMQQGYAIVGVIFDQSNPSNSYTYLGER
jgi:hypothetical protein